MKKHILYFFLFISAISNANMASPIQIGTLGGSPFLHQYVSITHENIVITLDENFDYAHFNVEYFIDAEKDGIQIPLLFYATEYASDFIVTIDGKPLKIETLSDVWNIPENQLKIVDYNLLYTRNDEIPTLKVGFKNSQHESISLNDFHYFKTDIKKGKHIIKVSYKASKWNYDHSRLKEESFRYALAPAKYWKSFGTLDITLDTSKCNEIVTTNLGKATSGEKKSVSKYHFDKLPQDMIEIRLEPQLSNFSKWLIKLESFNLALLLMLIPFLIHLKLMFNFRKKNKKSKLSGVAILGGILIPILFIFAIILATFLIDTSIGKYASGRASYGAFFSFIFLPKFLIIYLVISLIIDFILKKYGSNSTQ